MFAIGQTVLCVDDTYQDWVYELYTHLPIKGWQYIVRGTSIGRTKDQDIVECVLLEKIENPNDPFYHGNHELTFNAERFKELKTHALRR